MVEFDHFRMSAGLPSFVLSASEWIERAHKCSKHNHEERPLWRCIRDYATINEFICLSNMGNLNAVFIEQGMTQGERLVSTPSIILQSVKYAAKYGGGAYGEKTQINIGVRCMSPKMCNFAYST